MTNLFSYVVCLQIQHRIEDLGWTPQFGGEEIEGSTDMPYQITRAGETASVELFTTSLKSRAMGTQ